jgi:TM2 domain-containing membrane protein YozV
MNEILKIEESSVLIGLENGSVKEVSKTDLDFQPQVGDKVNLYTSKNELFVRKVENFNYLEEVYNSIDNQEEYILAKDDLGIYDLDEYLYHEVPGKALVNKWIYSVLAILVGGFGVHKFYAKKIGKGILYFLFFWTGVPFIIGIIEGVTAIKKESDIEGNILV